jgi:DNA processing protein
MEPPALDEATALAWLCQAFGRRRTRELVLLDGNAVAAVARANVEPRLLSEFGAAIARSSCALVASGDPRFPILLGHIPDPPLALYVNGDPQLLNRPTLAIVGARRCSRRGAEFAFEVASELAAEGVNVVSGLALGIDAAAHRGALAGGTTTAVLGSGHLNVHPASNRPLFREIVARGGVVISEYAPLQSARKHHFPERNRLVSGISRGVLVIEATDRSGSLITARFALEQGREVLAVPGSIGNPLSRGCHRLIKEGAALVECAQDVLEILGISRSGTASPLPMAGTPSGALEPHLVQLLQLIEFEFTPFDSLCARSTMSPEIIAAWLIELELGGFVEHVPGGYIRRAVAAPRRST